MNKTELTNAVADKTGLTKKESAKAIDALVSVITETVSGGDSVQLVGFGTFKTEDKAERQGRNPKTGDALTIPARTVVKFKAGKSLKDAVNS